MVSLRHPNITTVMGAVVEEGVRMLVMEYMEHRSLLELLQNETVPLEVETLQRIARGIACGMTYLHNHKPPILHRELRAANVLIDSTFRAKLADYGISRKCKENAHSSSQRLRYIAPEVLIGGEPTVESDVYAMVGLFLCRQKAPYPACGP
jgi:serine/threonine protein kinase